MKLRRGGRIKDFRKKRGFPSKEGSQGSRDGEGYKGRPRKFKGKHEKTRDENPKSGSFQMKKHHKPRFPVVGESKNLRFKKPKKEENRKAQSSPYGRGSGKKPGPRRGRDFSGFKHKTHHASPRLERKGEGASNISFPEVFRIDGKIATKNKVGGNRVYGERIVRRGGSEYRIWDPYRSKVAAAIAKGLKGFPINKESKVLYLGASSGTTASHISDIADTVYCVEFSKRMMRDLLLVCEARKNMIALLADARHPWEYSNLIGEVDAVVQDVAQPDQAGILINNLDEFGFKHALLSIKARSINSVGDPKKIFRDEVDKLRTRFNILQEISLEPFEEDHILVLLEAK
jgi:fibrillarin-like pre-rRNA processing protein